MQLEAAVRAHIRTEQQLKLHIEQMMETREQGEKEVSGLREQVKRMEREKMRMDEVLSNRDAQITSMQY